MDERVPAGRDCAGQLVRVVERDEASAERADADPGEGALPRHLVPFLREREAQPPRLVAPQPLRAPGPAAVLCAHLAAALETRAVAAMRAHDEDGEVVNPRGRVDGGGWARKEAGHGPHEGAKRALLAELSERYDRQSERYDPRS